MRAFLMTATLVVGLAATSFAADNLKLNPNLDYTSDSQDGPLITGDHMEAGAASGKPTYVIMYGEACYNSKRQARRTVSLYEKLQRPRAICGRRPRRLPFPQSAGTAQEVLSRQHPSRGCARFVRHRGV